MLYDDCLLQGDTEKLALHLGVSARTIQRMRKHPDRLDGRTKRLLRLYHEGDLLAIGGSGWEGFYLRRGLLFLPGWSNGWTPEKVRGLFFSVQEAAALRVEVSRLRAELWAARRLMRTVFPVAGTPQPQACALPGRNERRPQPPAERPGR